MNLQITPSMRTVIEYFEALGPRWGLEPTTCAVHALLYLTSTKLTAADVASLLDINEDKADAAIADLIDWRVVERGADGSVQTGSEPWDLLFAGMEERRRREIGPAMEAIGGAADQARDDGTTRSTARRINSLHELLQDLSSIGGQMDHMSSSTLKHAVRFGGQMSKFFGRR